MKILWVLVGVTAFIVVPAQEELKIPAKIIVPNKAATEYVDKGSKVLQCTATGNPTPTYEWRFNGEAVDSDYIEVNEKNGTLTIPTFTDREAGKYQCFAKNEIAPGIVAVTMSHIITLIKVEIGMWENVDQAPLRKYRGDPLSLTCDHQPVCKPPPIYSWYLAQGEKSKGQIKDSDRIYVDETGTLHFLYLIDKDVNGPLRYKCAIYNSVSATIKLGSTKNLEAITEKPGNSAPVREVMYSTKNAEFLRTKNAYLECVISGSPIAKIKWFKNDKEIVNGDKHEVQTPWGRKLTIKNVQLTDAGNYECVGDTTPEIRATVFLNVISGPIWESPLKDIVKPAGTDGVFQCRAMAIDGGDLNDSPVWFRNGQEMSVANTGKYEFRDSKRVLTVRNLVKPDDIQCFQCKVFNDVSEEYSSGCLNVIEPITIIEQPDEHQEITKGDMVNLTVIATTDPALSLEYWWRFNNATYLQGTSPPHVTYDDVTQTTFINTSALTQEEYKTINGTYFRIVRHAYENKTVAIHVTLTELPVVAPVVTAAVDLWWIALIVALIILLIVIILIVVICNRKRQEGTYPLDKKERANDIDPEKDLVDSGFHDLSRAPGEDDYPTKKTSRINPNFDYGDDMDMGDDDESLMEYGGADFDTTKFNEDGSFIGQYMSKGKIPEVQQSPQPLNHNATESQI